MGADLIVFLNKGPMKFTGPQVKRARLRAEKIILFASKVYETLDKRNKSINGGSGPPLTEEEEKFLENCLRDERLQGFNDQEQYSDIIECEDKMEEMAGATARDEVDKFVNWWETSSGRDTASRPDPDDRKQKLVVCGDMSWGDSPAGYGYTITQRAYWFDIPQSLEVR